MQRIEFLIAGDYAKTLQEMGRTFKDDNSLGQAQACVALLSALASGEYKLVKARAKKAAPKEEQEE